LKSLRKSTLISTASSLMIVKNVDAQLLANSSLVAPI
jgi:hypothetical protein